MTGNERARHLAPALPGPTASVASMGPRLRYWAALTVSLALSACGMVIESEETLQPRVPASSTAAGGGADGSVSFAADIQPLLDTYCGGCHTSSNSSAGVDTSSYQALMDGGLVQPGDPDGSPLLQVIEDRVMPPSGIDSPSDAEAGLIRAWIEAGAPNN